MSRGSGDPDLADLSSLALGLRVAVVEVENEVGSAGWDQPSRLFALVQTAELAESEPRLAAQLGLATGETDVFTAVEQELEDPSESLEALLGRIMWPESVVGALAVVERVVLPPDAEEEVPDAADAARDFAARHLGREEVRMAVGVLRSGGSHCVLRFRSRDDDALVHGADLVPGLVAALRETLEP